MKKIFIILLCFLTISCKFLENDNTENFTQVVINNSDFDIYYNTTLINSNETKNIILKCEYDEKVPSIIFSDKDFPRISVEKKLIKHNCYSYIVTNSNPVSIQVTNAAAIPITINNPYINPVYEADFEGITVSSGETKLINIYNLNYKYSVKYSTGADAHLIHI